MAISCDPNDLAQAAKQFQKLFPGQREWIDTYLLAVAAGLSTDPSALAVLAKDFQSVSPGQLRAMMAYSLCILAGGTPATTCPQDMEWAWTPAASKLGEIFGYNTDVGGNDSGLATLTFAGTTLNGFRWVNDSAGGMTFSFPNLVTDTGVFEFASIQKLNPVFAPLLASIDRHLVFVANDGMPSLSLPALTIISGRLDFKDHIAATSLSLPLLNNVGSDITISGNSSLTSVNLASLTITGAGVIFNSNPVLSALNITGINAIGGYFVISNTPITTLNLPGLVSINGDTDVAGLPSLVTVSLPNLLFQDGTPVNFSQNALDAASVNGILRRLVISNVMTCNIDLSGGTNAAPTGQGIVDKATLIGLGNTVATN